MLDAVEFFTSKHKKGFCMEQDGLIKFGILTKKHKSNNKKIERILNRIYNLKENKDYQHVKKGNATQVVLTQHAFHLCLVRYVDSCKYTNCHFYIIKVQAYYDDYCKAKKANQDRRFEESANERMRLLNRMNKQLEERIEMKAQLADMQAKLNMINRRLR